MSAAAFQTLSLVYNRSNNILREGSVRLEVNGLLMSHFKTNTQLEVDKRLCDGGSEYWLWEQGDIDSSHLLGPPDCSFFFLLLLSWPLLLPLSFQAIL